MGTYRIGLPMRGNNTNNLCEAQFLVIKDEILNHQKEVNVVAFVDKLTTDLDQHYCNKLLSVSSRNYICRVFFLTPTIYCDCCTAATQIAK